MEIIYSGCSNFGEGGLRSLQKLFNRVYILSGNPPEITSLKRANDILINDFSESDCKHVFLAGHRNFITEKQLKEKVYINVHGSLLPKYRGLHSTFWAIMNDEKKLGVTFHLVDKYMDSGDILEQYSFDYSGQTIKEINVEIDRLIERNAGKIIKNYLDGKIKPIKQNHEEATFGCKRNLDDCIIDFWWDNELLQKYFRALTPPYPLPRIVIDGKLYEIIRSKLLKKQYYSVIGRVSNINDDGIWIKTKDGFLIVSLVRSVDTGEMIDPKELVSNGYRFKNLDT